MKLLWSSFLTSKKRQEDSGDKSSRYQKNSAKLESCWSSLFHGIPASLLELLTKNLDIHGQEFHWGLHQSRSIRYIDQPPPKALTVWPALEPEAHGKVDVFSTWCGYCLDCMQSQCKPLTYFKPCSGFKEIYLTKNCCDDVTRCVALRSTARFGCPFLPAGPSQEWFPSPAFPANFAPRGCKGYSWISQVQVIKMVIKRITITDCRTPRLHDMTGS